MYPVERSAAVPVLEPVGASETMETVRTQSGGPARQVPLFDDRPKIIPFESLTERKTRARKANSVRREVSAATQTITVELRAAQQPLDLRPPAPRQRTAVTEDVPVACPAARIQAAFLDAMFLGCGVGLAAATFYLAGGRVSLTGRSAVPCGVAAMALVMFYHLFWCVLGRESAGMRAMGLRMLTFDGQRPAWPVLVVRFVAACFSVAAVGIGALWALIDEEGLTWHDHITKTFPTEYNPRPSTMRRQ